jgi:hypothetical protein
MNWKKIQYEFRCPLGSLTTEVEVSAETEAVCFKPGEENRLERMAVRKFLASADVICPEELLFILHAHRISASIFLRAVMALPGSITPDQIRQVLAGIV